MKAELPHLLLAVDLGGSGTKIVGGIQGVGERALIMMPHCAEIDGSLDRDLSFDHQNVWVKICDTSYAVGNLAATKFNATNKLKPAKFTLAVPKICAAIAAFCQLFNLPPKFNLSLTFVLPPAEWEQKTIVIERLESALKDFDTPKGKIKPKLLSISANPEGLGILLGQGLNLKEFANITTVMLGHRNASVLATKYGVMSRPQTSNLGFQTILKDVASQTGYRQDDLINLVVKYKKIKPRIDKHVRKMLKALSKKVTLEEDYTQDFIDSQANQCRMFVERDRADVAKIFESVLNCSGADREVELNILTDAIDKSIGNYKSKLTDWLGENMESGLDYLCLCGGTSSFLLDDIKPFLFDKLIQKEAKRLLKFDTTLPKDCRSSLLLTERYHDIYCLYLQLQTAVKISINHENTPYEIDEDKLSDEDYLLCLDRRLVFNPQVVFEDDD